MVSMWKTGKHAFIRNKISVPCCLTIKFVVWNSPLLRNSCSDSSPSGSTLLACTNVSECVSVWARSRWKKSSECVYVCERALWVLSPYPLWMRSIKSNSFQNLILSFLFSPPDDWNRMTVHKTHPCCQYASVPMDDMSVFVWMCVCMCVCVCAGAAAGWWVGCSLPSILSAIRDTSTPFATRAIHSHH